MSTPNDIAPNMASLLANLPNSLDHAPWAVTELSGQAHIIRYANSAFCQMINKSRDEIVGRPFDNVLQIDDKCLTLLDRVFRTGAAANYSADEQDAPLPLLYSYNLWPVKAAGKTAGVMIQVNETGPVHATREAISQALLLGALRQDELIQAADLANTRLQAEISARIERENDAKLLTNELAHRIKNNLQVVAALIGNEVQRTPEPWVQGYRATQARIMAIAELYDLMSQTSRDRTVDLDGYLPEIAKALSASLLGNKSGIQIAVEVEALEIDAERGVPLGLLVNELITNAVKHAFPGGSGLVTLTVQRNGKDATLRVADNGIGMAAQGQEGRLGKHGSDYVTIFVRQIRGTLVRCATPGAGTTVSIRFPL
jgi:two-component sensor histidine kinase